jgi:hypothetical protein
MTRAHCALRVVLCTLLLGWSTTLHAQRKVNERFAAPRDVEVSILNIAGSLKITGWDRDSVVVMGTVHDTPAERFIVHRSGAGVKAGIWDTTVERAEPSHVEVRVPAGARLTVRTGSASVFVSGVEGGIEVNSVRGDVEIRGSPREVFAESMMGSIVLDVRTPLARTKTVTAAARIHGRITDLTATSVSGSVLLENAEIERGSFESVDGELRFVGRVMPRAVLGFVTHGGAIEFLLPADTDAAFRVGSYAGALTSEFSAPVRSTASKIKGSDQGFTLGAGSAQVNVRTFRGRVVVRSR